jgi:hypothetical protein
MKSKKYLFKESRMSTEIDDMVKKLKDAAAQLEKEKNSTQENQDKAMGDVMSCCGTCTGISSIPPCKNACIIVSPLF